MQDGSQSYSFAEVLRRASSVAAHLQREGLAPGNRVALILNNSIDFVAAYYGTLLAGGVAVLLNAAAKARDLQAWLKDCTPTFALIEEGHSEANEAVGSFGSDLRTWRTSSGNCFGCEIADVPRRSERSENDPACILYTSGTTGKPKGATLSHRNLASNTAAIVEYLGLDENDSIVTILPFYYSYGCSVLNTHIRAGARLILEKNFVYPHAVVETLARERATGFSGVPATFSLLLSRVRLEQFDLTALRYITQAGGPMTVALTRTLRTAVPNAKLFVMYGQTEAAARLTYLPPEHLETKLGSVGIPIRDVQIQIRDESGAKVPNGTVGEVWAHGPNVMLGYWRNETATKEVVHDGWLKTGDMGRLDDDGFLHLVGRRTDMIKAGAHRVHPMDVEEVIAELPHVEDVAVVGLEDEILGQSIKAFVVLNTGGQLTPMQVQAHCRARLANYKVPKSVEIVPSLPRTASGKIRRIELIERKSS